MGNMPLRSSLSLTIYGGRLLTGSQTCKKAPSVDVTLLDVVQKESKTVGSGLPLPLEVKND
jgi:hypothetical protein